MYTYPLACKHAQPTHTQPHIVMANALIIDPSFYFFALMFNGLCFLSTFKSRNHCSHSHIKIPPPRDVLLCGRLVAWLMSECAHPHKRTLMSQTPLNDTRAGLHAWMPARAHTHTHTHTSHCPMLQLVLMATADACRASSKQAPASTPGTC